MLCPSQKHIRLKLLMAGTQTAPLQTAAATYRTLSISFIDSSGDVWTESIRIDAAASAINMDAMIADIQERTNASIWKTELTESREGAASSTNTTVLPRSQSVFDHVLMTFKNIATGMAQRIYIPAPLEATMQDPQTDLPNMTDLADLGTASLVVLGAGYTLRSARYTEMREINAAVKP